MAGKIRLCIDSTGYTEKPVDQYGLIRWRMKRNGIQEVTVAELIKAIQQGRAFYPAALTGDKSESWKSQQIIAADIDNSGERYLQPDEAVRIMNEAGIEFAIMYWTYSRTEEHPKFRILCVLESPVSSAAEGSDLTARLAALFNKHCPKAADTAIKDPARLLLAGPPDCIFYERPTRRTTRESLLALPPANEQPMPAPAATQQQATPTTQAAGGYVWAPAVVQSMLDSIPVAECTHDEWLHIGMALKSAGYPCEVWDAWSSAGADDKQDPRYNPGECSKRWNTFTGQNSSGKSVDLRVLWELAARHGWTWRPAATQKTYGWNDVITTDGPAPGDSVDVEIVPGMTVHTTEPGGPAGEDPGEEQAPPPPAWYTGRQNDTGIIDAVFAETFARDIGWTRTGYTLRTPAGEIVTESDALRTIVETVRQYCPLVSYQKAKRLFAMTRLYLPEDKAADDLDLCTAEALDAMPLEAMVFNVNQLLPAGLTVLAAPPKTGKSWLALALADAIATGSTFFGLDTRRGACLYCALEDSRYRVQDRLRKIGSTMPPNLSIVTRGTKRLDSGLLQQLEKWITATPDPRLIIVDTLARVRPLASTGLDAYNADTAAIAPLQALALAHGVSILLITHYRKTYQAAMDADPFDRITGSNGLFAVADSAWLIYGKRGGDDMTFRTTGRDATDTELKIEFDKDSCRWQVIGTAAAVEAQKALDAYRASPLFRTIRQLVSEAGVWRGTAADLMKAVADFTGEPGGDPRTIGVDLAENAALLLKEDGIHYSKDAGGRKGRAYTFQRVKALA